LSAVSDTDVEDFAVIRATCDPVFEAEL
jgi:hypothetical protein